MLLYECRLEISRFTDASSNFFPVAATSRNKLQPGATPRNQTRENPALGRPKYRTSQEDAKGSRQRLGDDMSSWQANAGALHLPTQ